MTKKETAAPLRVDLYIRVSGQEQAIKGLSLEAQQHLKLLNVVDLQLQSVR